MQRQDYSLLSPSLGSHKTLTSLHFGMPGSTNRGSKKVYIQASLHAEELPGMLVAHHLRALLEAGVTPQRVSAASFSEYHPTAANDGDANRARNRRIEIVVVPDLSGLPGFRELQKLTGGG